MSVEARERAKLAKLEVMRRIASAFVPFADAASADLPLSRLFRLSLFQVSVGVTLVLLGGTLNRVMAVELQIPVSAVALALALPLIAAPARALIGFRSDMHRSYLGWRRTPYIWIGSLIQFGGLAIMPFSLLIVSEADPTIVLAGQVGMLVAFLMVGAGTQTVQTAGLALACDLSSDDKRPRVVAMLYTMLLLGMLGGALIIGRLLQDFSPLRLIQLLQGSAVLTILMTLVAIWQQEPRRRGVSPDEPEADGRERRRFASALRALAAHDRSLLRLLVALSIGTAAFGMQDVLLEPYGGEVFGMSVGATTFLTALFASGSLAGYFMAARFLGKSAGNPFVVAACGLLIGIPAFSAVVFAGAFHSIVLFGAGTVTIGIGAGLFSVSMLIAAMARVGENDGGLVLGAFGAVQAMALGLAVFFGGALRDIVADLAGSGTLGFTFTEPASGYGVVYHIEIGLLFVALAALGPLVKPSALEPRPSPQGRLGLADMPN